MRANHDAGSLRFGSVSLLLVAALGVVGCSDNQASKSWSALAVCVVGSAAQSPTPERMKQLRAIQLSNAGKADKPGSWPGSCATYANQLYAALDGSGPSAGFKRNLQSKLGCGSEKPSCVLNTETVTTLVSDLWDGAKSAELKLEPAGSIPKPEISQQPVMTNADWKPLLKQAGQVVGPQLTPDGRVRLLVKSSGGRMRPWGCEFKAGFAEAQCFSANDKVPMLPPQSIQLVNDPKEFYVGGLTEDGLAAFEMRTGESSVAKGAAGNVFHEGLAVERGEGDKGYAVFALAKGKAGKPIELPVKDIAGAPMSFGDQIAWVEPAEGGSSLIVKSLKGKKVVDRANVSGKFIGPFHTCAHGQMLAVATYAGHTGQHGAKPNVGANKTQFTITIFNNGSWSKAFEAELPFQRAIESDLVCTADGASLVLAQNVEGGVQVSQLNCTADGCKTAEAKLPNIESRWWWTVGPMGDKVLLIWRAALGEARMRLAPIAQLEQAKEVVLFDDQDHGGPKAGEALPVYSDNAALLVFKDEPPVALTVQADGTARLVTAK
jgi:hypothetical protein